MFICEALWVCLVYEKCYINKVALPCLAFLTFSIGYKDVQLIIKCTMILKAIFLCRQSAGRRLVMLKPVYFKVCRYWCMPLVLHCHASALALSEGPVYTKGKRRYFHPVWPLIYMKTLFFSQKTIISKNSGQSDFWKRRLSVVVSTGRNRVLGSEASHYAPGNA